MPVRVPLFIAAAALAATACSHTLTGMAVQSPPGIDGHSLSPVDIQSVVLTRQEMRAVTGSGDELTEVPGMDSDYPVDIEPLVNTIAAQCQWVFAESRLFGSEVEDFHKTTFQNPARGGLISEGVAAYRDPPAARRAYDGVVRSIGDCATTSEGAAVVGDWTATADTARTNPGACGRQYRVKSVVLVEVTYCGFLESVPDIVMTNMLADVPG